MINLKIGLKQENENVYFEAFILETPNSKTTQLPVLIICPGGGFVFCSENEAENIGFSFLDKDFHIVVLHYSVYDTEKNFKEGEQLKELGQVYDWILKNAHSYNFDINQINLLGFSAGGNLVLNFNNHFENQAVIGFDVKKWPKINKIIVGYPRLKYNSLNIDANNSLINSSNPNANIDDAIKWYTKRNLALFGVADPSFEQQQKFSPIQNITAKHPPVFIFQARDDDTTLIEETIDYVKKLQNLNIKYQLHIYNTGGHGFGDGSSRNNNKVLSTWITEAIYWLNEREVK
ncbi:hypothetical protein SCLARK_00719 [Spiroplasma clarkii]|uniref:Alpha/beta hydrolase n=1 Tax=Spiroplasma clarkii TaxID=2139 RepID=A0A1Y0L031_9MOLU|nr:alpha/beta hydrolase [Spiroplasma clarkii]ARU91372.1 hypothetical protein SCLARK_00719 [Spiroplasma clarkii]ATX70788.1 alpha/beta hydrolase [Spiroplasma clarkii]